ncbi:MAG: dTMP kinase [Spirochaetes bacterium]|nr:dTMP kinase [Spirochaetota bacterium]
MQVRDTHSSLKNFVVFEGIDGSGTTTQLKMLAEALKRNSVLFETTAEPTDRPEGQLIRHILKGEIDADPGTVAYLFATDRHQHLHGKAGILSILQKGSWVFCDRYILSSLAYQGITCGEELPRLLNSPFPHPGLTIYFRIDPERSMERVLRRESLEIYEKIHMQKLVSAAYDRIVEKKRAEGWNIELVNAELDIGEVGLRVRRIVGSHLGIGLD